MNDTYAAELLANTQVQGARIGAGKRLMARKCRCVVSSGVVFQSDTDSQPRPSDFRYSYRLVFEYAVRCQHPLTIMASNRNIEQPGSELTDVIPV